MRTFSVVLIALLVVALVAAPISQAGERHYTHKCSRDISFKSFNTFEADDARFHLGKDEIVISHLEAPYEEIVITDEYRMYIDDEEVSLTAEQREIVREFYGVSFQIRSEAKGLAKEGVKLGIKGAKLGIHAVGAALKMLFADWDEEEFERKMEHEAEKLEAEGELLESRGEKIELLADRWQELGLQMKEDIAPLREMDWL